MNSLDKDSAAEWKWFPRDPTRLACTLGPGWDLDLDPKKIPDASHLLYALATREDAPVHRADGRRSRLLYVGMGRRNRPLSLVDGSHSASHALDGLRRRLAKDGARLPVELWVTPSENCALQEVLVLNRCVQEYGELPPANLRWEGYLSGETLRRLARWALDEHPVPNARVDVYEWPGYDAKHDGPTSVWADVMVGKTWHFSLAWFHTDALLHGRPGAMRGRYNGQLLLIEAGGSGNALADDDDFASWGSGHPPVVVPAAELDGISAPTDAIQAWLERYTSNQTWKRGASAFDTLRLTFEANRPGLDPS